MRCIPGLALAVILSGCATAVPAASDASRGVTTHAHAPVDVAAYNHQIERQGIGHYCGSGECDQLPVLLQAYAPVYPAAALKARLSGSAVIVFDVLQDGTLADFRVESASAQSFADAAIQALKLGKFAPAELRGKPVRTTDRQRFPFNLR